jgi:TRAP transporter TAXI family solute receptor
MRRKLTITAGVLGAIALVATPVAAEEYGFAVKRPVMGAACPTCVWGPFAEVTKRIMSRYGWDIQICWNCNSNDSPRFVAQKRIPPVLTPQEVKIGDLPAPKSPVDFGVTTQRALIQSYNGTFRYKEDGPQPQLRLIAAFQDMNFLAVAVRKESGITDLAQISAKHLPVRIYIGAHEDDPPILPILQYYKITKEQLESWGGKFVSGGEARKGNVDVIINRNASTPQNAESQFWSMATLNIDLNFIEIAPDLRTQLVKELGYRPAVMPAHYFRGVDIPINTLELSGQAVYARDDMPEQAAYELAKGMDLNRQEYLWSIRPFILDPREAMKVGNVPLHPGAARYYREAGYMK